MANEDKLLYYSQLSIKDLENQLLNEKVCTTRNLIRQVIRNKRNEDQPDSKEIDIDKISDITILNKMFSESTDFFDKCKIRSAILHIDKLRKQDNFTRFNESTQNSEIFNSLHGIDQLIKAKELVKDDLNKIDVESVSVYISDSVRLSWILPFKILSSIEYYWNFNGVNINDMNGKCGTVPKFSGRVAILELNNVNEDNSGLYTVVINSTRLKKTFQTFKIIANKQTGNVLSSIIIESESGVNAAITETEGKAQVGIKNSTEIICKTPETNRRLYRNMQNHRHRTLGGDELMTAVKKAKEKTNSLTDVDKIESPRAPLRKFVRSATTAKDIILMFCKINTTEYKEQGVSVENLSSSWSDGLAFCALIHHFYPDAFDFSQLSSINRRKNFELAFQTAEKLADIYPLLDVEDMMIMEKPDWKCIFTYVQCFYKTFRSHPLNKLRTMIVS